MKSSLIMTIMLIIFCMTTLTLGGIKQQSRYQQEYKRALDAATDAALKHLTYVSNENLEDLSLGFGVGLENGNNLKIDKDKALLWFYRVLFRNLDIQDNVAGQEKLKYYIPMKAIISFNGVAIADVNDNWVIDKEFIIEYTDKKYLFTLSNQIKDIENDEWYTDTELGISKDERQGLVTKFIVGEINSFMSTRENKESEITYNINIGLNDMDNKLKGVSGSNMIVISEGIPIKSNNWFNPEKKYYAFSIGGSEIFRKN